MTSSPTRPSPRVAPTAERAVLVDELDARAVELRLHDVVERSPRSSRRRTRSSNARSSVLAHRVVEREHRHAVDELGEALGGRRADALRRRIGARELRVRCLERLELAEQRVVLRVGDLGRVLLVVEAQVAVQLGGAVQAIRTLRVARPLLRSGPCSKRASPQRCSGSSSEGEIGAM